MNGSEKHVNVVMLLESISITFASMQFLVMFYKNTVRKLRYADQKETS